MGEKTTNSAVTLPEVIDICLSSLEEVKTAYSEASKLQDKLVELEKVAAAAPKYKEIDSELVTQTVRNLVASSFLESAHAEKLATELKRNPEAALHLVQRFIEISAPPFSEGQGVDKIASEDNTLGDPDGWSNVVSYGA